MTKSLRLLYLEDNSDDASLLPRKLAHHGIHCHVLIATSRSEFLKALQQGGFDLILSDYTLPDFDGLQALALALEKCPEVPFLMISGCIREQMATETIKRGAVDFVLKDRWESLASAMRRAMKEVDERTERKRREETLLQTRDALEQRVRERTAELTQANAILHDEIAEHKQSEEALRLKTQQVTALASQMEVKTDLLVSLTEAMVIFLESGDYKKANASLLRCALSHTRSEYGFIGVVTDGLMLRIVAQDGLVWDEGLNPAASEEAERTFEKLGYLEFAPSNSVFGSAVITGKVVVSNDAGQHSRSSGPASGHPPLINFLSVPIHSGSKIVGMIAVANRPGGYTGSEQVLIETLLNGVGVLCDAYLRQEREIALETSRKRLELANRESNERFRLLVEGVKDCAIFMLDLQGLIISWNSGAEKMTGCTAGDVIGQHFSCFHSKEDIKSGQPGRALQTATATGHFDDECWRVRKDRTQFWADVIITAVSDESGNLRGFANVIRDITERKYAEQVLRASEERTRLIVESAHDAFVSTDANGLISDWNRQAEKIFGWTSDEVIGRPVAATLLPQKYRRAYERGLKRYQASGQGLPLNRRFQMVALHRDGHPLPVEVTITSIQLGQGYIFSAFFRDITERQQAEELLGRLPGQILTAQETERKRVARELHDSVSQTLCSVKISLRSLEQKLSSHHREAWKAAVQTRNLLEGCIDEVRRIAHNLMPSELEDLGLVPALRSLCREFRLKTPIKLRLTYSKIPAELPNTVKLHLFRIVQEALTNIEKHSQATHVTVRLARNGPLIKAIIQDNGKGFNPYDSRRTKRSGMGVTNMKERAAFVGGRVEMRSVSGEGTLIEVEIPASLEE